MNHLTRREFIGGVAGLAAAGLLDGCTTTTAGGGGPDVSLDWKSDDAVATSPPGQWAIGRLRQTLESQGLSVGINSRANLRIAVNAMAMKTPESFSIVPGKNALFVGASDPRGLVYALTDLADRVECASDARQALSISDAIAERPANRIRSVTRLFVSDVEDKSWFHDRDFWRDYLTMLATQRFNRFNLALGLGYDAPRQLRDTYFYFAYPFLLDVPGYSVRAGGLSNEERDRNLATLQFISEQTALRGMQFQLGLWTHGFEWTDSPDANYVIEGLTASTQAPYCRDALHMLLEACPAVTGVTLRIHGESGVPEGDYEFWRSLFGGVAATGRRIELDLHAKGIDQQMIDVALGSGLPVTVSPKFWAEHMGLPYMPASIRQTEMPTGRSGTGLFALSNGARSFMRYSYGDLLKKDRQYGILHRVWPGTQRLLLWGDPKFAAAYGRAFSFCGTDGVEFFDPLSFKGRKGSGLPGGRDGYASEFANTGNNDWRKFGYTYRLLGRLTYNSDADADVWQRGLRHEFGSVAPMVETALASASRILPMITASHDPSAANYSYWPEMYTNMSIVDASNPGPYTDTPRPRDFCHVSPLDPQLFATVQECAAALVSGTRIGKYTPLDVATQLEQWEESSQAASLNTFQPRTHHVVMAMDSAIVCGIGRFFARKFRAAVLFSIFDLSGDEAARQAAISCYQSARDAWAAGANVADGVYVRDITFGPDRQMRGHWLDRLAAIDRDIAAMRAHPAPNVTRSHPAQAVAAVITAVMTPTTPPLVVAQHTPPVSFVAGEPINLQLQLSDQNGAAVKLWYRRVDQSEVFQSVQMSQMDMRGSVYRAVVPGDYTKRPFAIQYYFEIEPGMLYPGLGLDFAGVPYYVVQPS